VRDLVARFFAPPDPPPDALSRGSLYNLNMGTTEVANSALLAWNLASRCSIAGLFRNPEQHKGPAVGPAMVLEELALVTLKDGESEERCKGGTAFSSDTDVALVVGEILYFVPSFLSSMLNRRCGGVPRVLRFGTQIDVMLDAPVYLRVAPLRPIPKAVQTRREYPSADPGIPCRGRVPHGGHVPGGYCDGTLVGFQS
jgi:hypothetical protein